MKTRNEFLTDFFQRLESGGFMVLPVPDSDLAAEVYAGDSLFCVVTQDGEIIYENYDSGKARALEQLAEETRRAQGCHIKPPFVDMECMEAVTLTSGSYVKVFESAGVVLLCRRTALFGYEFVTAQKAAPKHNSRRLYRELYHYDPVTAQEVFMGRSGLSLPDAPHFTHEELRVLVSCCARCVMLDNELDTDAANRINTLMAKLEGYLPPQPEVSPRHYFQNEIGG